MITELVRLFLGLLIALFHRPIADFILQQERSLVVLFRERGVPLPAAPTTERARNLYFFFGIGIAILEMGRIYLMLNGRLLG